MRKTLFVSLLFLFSALASVAQNLRAFSVVSFEEKPFDITAKDKRYEKIDGNGNPFSILKLVSNTPDDDLRAYSFDFGLCEDLPVTNVVEEVWLYVQCNAMHATIKRDGFKTVKYELNTTVQPGRVYEMVLQAAPKVIQRQFLMFEISPLDSEALITYRNAEAGGDYRPFAGGKVDAGGRSAMSLELGSYAYKILSTNYHPSEGFIVLDKPNEKHIEKVTLRPNFANVKLSVDNDAEIYINEEKKGVGSWSGKLSPGAYSVECRKENHKSSMETITVEEGKDIALQLQAPMPITGTLSLTSNPLGAKITIEGKSCGETPDFVSGLIIGEHKVILSMAGYESKTLTVVIEENATAEYSVELQKKPESQARTSSSKGSSSENYNGHGYVDLGLSVKWATCNVGASKPEDYGDYFAWGETKPKSSYNSSNSVTYGKSMGDIGGNARYDAARANWGGSWRLPTKAEFEELFKNCTWTWTVQGGKNGYKVTSKKNGNSIFLPAAGYCNGTSLYYGGSGFYWSSTPYEDSTYRACSLNFRSGVRGTGWYDRFYGQSVRPVSE